MSDTTHTPTSSPAPTAPAGSESAGPPVIDLPTTRDDVPDRAWCPGSNDLVAALPELFATLGQQNLVVRRVVYHPTTWLAAPRRLVTDSRRVDLSPSRALHPHVLRLFLSGSNRCIDLMVILPAASP